MVVSLESGMPVFHQSFTRLKRDDKDEMHYASIFSALSKIKGHSSKIDENIVSFQQVKRSLELLFG